MPEVVTCPQCERQLRVPDELVGQRVKCPTCGTNFTANVGLGTRPPGGEEGPRPRPPEQPPPLPSEPYAERGTRAGPQEREEYDDRGYREDYPRARSDRSQRALDSLKAPGILLIITGVLGILVNLGQIVWVMAPKPPPPPLPANPNPFEKMMADIQQGQAGPLPVVLGGAFALISLIVMLGGINMVRGQGYGLAMAGSILAMVNLGNCCCLLGLPIGIWSLVVLANENTKNAFR